MGYMGSRHPHGMTITVAWDPEDGEQHILWVFDTESPTVIERLAQNGNTKQMFHVEDTSHYFVRLSFASTVDVEWWIGEFFMWSRGAMYNSTVHPLGRMWTQKS